MEKKVAAIDLEELKRAREEMQSGGYTPPASSNSGNDIFASEATSADVSLHAQDVFSENQTEQPAAVEQPFTQSADNNHDNASKNTDTAQESDDIDLNALVDEVFGVEYSKLFDELSEIENEETKNNEFSENLDKPVELEKFENKLEQADNQPAEPIQNQSVNQPITDIAEAQSQAVLDSNQSSQSSAERDFSVYDSFAEFEINSGNISAPKNEQTQIEPIVNAEPVLKPEPENVAEPAIASTLVEENNTKPEPEAVEALTLNNSNSEFDEESHGLDLNAFDTLAQFEINSNEVPSSNENIEKFEEPQAFEPQIIEPQIIEPQIIEHQNAQIQNTAELKQPVKVEAPEQIESFSSEELSSYSAYMSAKRERNYAAVLNVQSQLDELFNILMQEKQGIVSQEQKAEIQKPQVVEKIPQIEEVASENKPENEATQKETIPEETLVETIKEETSREDTNDNILIKETDKDIFIKDTNQDVLVSEEQSENVVEDNIDTDASAKQTESVVETNLASIYEENEAEVTDTNLTDPAVDNTQNDKSQVELEAQNAKLDAVIESLEKHTKILDLIDDKKDIQLKIKKVYPQIQPYKFLEAISSEKFKNSSNLTYLMGKNAEGNLKYGNLRDNYNLAVFGKKNRYTAGIVHSILLSLMLKNSNEELSFVICDAMEDTALDVYNGSKYMYFSRISKTNTEIQDTLLSLNKELDARYDYLAKIGVKSIEQYNIIAKNDNLKPMPYIVTVINNYSKAMQLTEADVINASLYKMLKFGRITGMYVIIVSASEIEANEINYNLPTRIAFACDDDNKSLATIGEEGAEQLSDDGDFLCLSVGNDDLSHLKVASISRNEIKLLIENIEQ